MAFQPATTKITLPDGLDWDTVCEAVSLIEDWELQADGLATDLVIELYKLFGPKLC